MRSQRTSLFRSRPERAARRQTFVVVRRGRPSKGGCRPVPGGTANVSCGWPRTQPRQTVPLLEPLRAREHVLLRTFASRAFRTLSITTCPRTFTIPLAAKERSGTTALVSANSDRPTCLGAAFHFRDGSAFAL